MVITHNTNAAGTEVVFNCNPLLSNVVDVGTVEIEVEWFVNDRVVEEETFRLQDKTVGTLGQTMWTVGQTVRVWPRPTLLVSIEIANGSG